MDVEYKTTFLDFVQMPFFNQMELNKNQRLHQYLFIEFYLVMQ